MKHGYLRPIPENAKKLVNDVGKITGKHKEKLDYCYTENFLVVQIPRGIRIELPDSGHSHDAYEFIIPREPMPYLVRENSIYFGEVGKIYPVQSGLSHRSLIMFRSKKYLTEVFIRVIKQVSALM